jgi:hypothetical protein
MGALGVVQIGAYSAKGFWEAEVSFISLEVMLLCALIHRVALCLGPRISQQPSQEGWENLGLGFVCGESLPLHGASWDFQVLG